MEHLGRCVTEWRVSLIGKALNVNAGKRAFAFCETLLVEMVDRI